MHNVYILYSSKINRYYIGYCSDIAIRFEQHNNVNENNNWTKRGIPWELYLVIDCESKNQAIQIEYFIKKMKSRQFLQRIKSDNDLQDDLKSRFSQ